MRVEGYARLIVDPTGQKYRIEDVWMTNHILHGSLDPDVLTEYLGEQLPSELRDVQVLCVFGYYCEKSYVWDYACYEYEDTYPLLSHTVIREGYKGEWAAELQNHVNDPDIVELMADWEDFYGESLQKPIATGVHHENRDL
jgi:hypothetical protein